MSRRRRNASWRRLRLVSDGDAERRGGAGESVELIAGGDPCPADHEAPSRYSSARGDVTDGS